MKIMFTGAGRRVEFIQAFRNAARELEMSLQIYGADMSESAPALYFCDKTEIVCPADSEEYIPSLVKICEKERIDCLIPTIDTDLILLAVKKELFEEKGVKVLISEAKKVKICRDKRLTSEYFRSLGLKAPFSLDSADELERLLSEEKAAFPLFIKPRDGSSSIDAYKAESFGEIKVYADRIGEYVIQPFIEGREYTVDIFCNDKGEAVYITPRERIVVRAGEVLKTKIVQDEMILREMKLLTEDYKPCGPITVQLIREKATGEDIYIEINPRFGGGAPLSMKAGADSAKALLRMLRGESLSYMERAARDGAVYSRFDQSICINDTHR